jgi:hypothetical protein
MNKDGQPDQYRSGNEIRQHFIMLHRRFDTSLDL